MRNKRMAIITNNGSLPDLPFDIIYNILSRLPTKPLIKFKCVSKSWNALISDREFARVHHARSMMDSSRQSLLLGRNAVLSPARAYGIIQSTGIPKTHMEKVYFSSEELENGVLMCSCEHLVLLMDKELGENNSIILWNPSLSRYTTVPCPSGLFIDLRDHVLGLCYDSSADDYKVVIIASPSYVVYSLKNSSWSQRKHFSSDYDGISETPSVFVNGFLHWVVTMWNNNNNDDLDPGYGVGWYVGLEGQFYNRRVANVKRYGSGPFQDDVNHSHEILCFDPKEEKFEVLVPRPEALKETNVFYLTDLNGRLGLYCFNERITKVSIWLWEGKSHDYYDKNNPCAWVELRTVAIRLPSRVTPRYGFHIRPLFMTVDMKMIFHINWEEIAIYDLKKSQSRRVSWEFDGRYAYAVPFLDSLLLPGVDGDIGWLPSKKK